MQQFCLEAGSELQAQAFCPSAGQVHVCIRFFSLILMSFQIHIQRLSSVTLWMLRKFKKCLTLDVLNSLFCFVSSDWKEKENSTTYRKSKFIKTRTTHTVWLTSDFLHLRKTSQWWVLKASAQPWYIYTGVFTSAWLDLLSGLCEHTVLDWHLTC